MGYSLKIIECSGATDPQLFVCEMATAYNNILADVERLKNFDRRPIILVAPDHHGELQHAMKCIELTAPIVECPQDVLEMAREFVE